MRKLEQFLALALWVAASSLLFGAVAADVAAATDATAGAALSRDALCTACHDQSWPQPVLSVYQTPHGNRADARAPSCQSCHGESEAHRNDPAGAHPDMVFAIASKNVSPADQRSGVCLGCHQAGLRMHW